MSDVKPIKDADHYDRVMSEIKQLMVRTLSKEESDYLSMLITIVQDYKDKGENNEYNI